MIPNLNKILILFSIKHSFKKRRSLPNPNNHEGKIYKIMGKWKKLGNPEIFQGNKKKKSYFEGWYFKMVNQDGSNIYAIIPGIALDKKNNTSHSFIQFFDGIKGEYNYFTYDVNDFQASEDKFEVSIGNNFFSSQEIHLDINQQGKRIKGDLIFKNLVQWPKKFLSPGIMGFFSYFPMQTKHGIVSMNHDILGSFLINNNKALFREGSKGYIEKDWGSSFPTSWIWMQSNHFSEPKLSFLLSVASIPFLGFKFTGYFCAIWHNGKIYNFATYTRAKLRTVQVNGNKVFIMGEDKKYQFKINAIQERPTDMKAPSLGEMRGHCFESMNSNINVSLIDRKNEKLIFEDRGRYAGLEIMDNNELQR